MISAQFLEDATSCVAPVAYEDTRSRLWMAVTKPLTVCNGEWRARSPLGKSDSPAVALDATSECARWGGGGGPTHQVRLAIQTKRRFNAVFGGMMRRAKVELNSYFLSRFLFRCCLLGTAY